jgi:hypothetical protein
MRIPATAERAEDAAVADLDDLHLVHALGERNILRQQQGLSVVGLEQDTDGGHGGRIHGISMRKRWAAEVQSKVLTVARRIARKQWVA